MRHLIQNISALGLIPILIITASSCGSRESKTQGSDSIAVAIDMPFDTLVTFCNWTELGLRATPSEKGKYVTTVYLGEHLTLSGDTASEVTQGKKILFHKVALLDGTVGWLRDEFVAIDAVPAVVVQEAPIYKRPEETTMSDNNFHVLDVVALKPSKGNWVEANGKPSDKTWFQRGYVHLENFSLAKRDVDFALLYRRAMETKDAAKQQSQLDHIRTNGYFESSVLYDLVFPPEGGSMGHAGEGVGDDPDFTMYNFSNTTGDLVNQGATFIPDGDGVPNSALFFNGSAFLSKALNDDMEASFCFWIMPAELRDEAIPFIVGNACTSGYAINLVNDQKGGMQVTVLCGGVEADVTSSSYSLALNKWTHLCLVKSGNNFSLYADGELTSTGTSGYNPPAEGLTFGGAPGCNPPGVKGSFYGNLDDLYIANFALDAAGVLEVKSGKLK